MIKTERYKPSVFISALALYLFCMPLDFLPVIPGVSLSKLLMIIPIIGSVFCIDRFGYFKRTSFIVLLYPLAIFISMFVTIDWSASLARMISIILNVVVIIFLTSRRYTKEELNFLFSVVGLSGWFLCVLCAFFSKFSADGRLTIIVNDAAQDQNYLCGFLLLPACYYLWRFLQEKKPFAIASVGIFALLIFLTGSRGGTLSLLVSCLVLLFNIAISSRSKLWKIVVFLIFAAIFIIIIWGFLPEEITLRFSPEFNEEDKGSHRIRIWESLFKHFGESDFLRQMFGNGAGTVTNYSFENRVAHNVFIEALVEMGVLGLLLISFMYFHYGYTSWKKNLPFLSAAFLGYMSMCMTLSLYSYKPIWNIILLIIISVGCKEDEDYTIISEIVVEREKN